MVKQSNRQYYIDWLRSVAMFLIVIYHSGRLFDYDGWHIKNAELTAVIDIFNRFLDIWQMPLFFLLAGASVWFALERRSLKEFAFERVLRLFVPLVFGILMLVPPQVYLERLFRGQFSGSYFEWWPNTFQGIYPEGNFSWHHLWFLAYLFTFSLILLPLFRYFRSTGGRRLVAKFAGIMERPGAILLPVIPLVIINLTLRPIYGYGNQNLFNDWANFLYYSTILLYGYILVSDESLVRVFERNWKSSLIVAAVLSLFLRVVSSGVINAPDLDWLGKIIVLAGRAICNWYWLIAFVGFGKRYLNFTNRILEYASAASMPVYILHQTVIVAIGYFIVQSEMPVWLKYPIVIAGAFFFSIAGYELIRRTGFFRFLLD